MTCSLQDLIFHTISLAVIPRIVDSNGKSGFVTHVVRLVQEGGGTFRRFYIFGIRQWTTAFERKTVHHQVIILPFSPWSEHSGSGGIA